MKNRLKHWRHKYEMERKEFAEFLEVNYFHYIKWENQKLQPSVESLQMLRNKLREKFPQLTIDDLLEWE